LQIANAHLNGEIVENEVGARGKVDDLTDCMDQLASMFSSKEDVSFAQENSLEPLQLVE